MQELKLFVVFLRTTHQLLHFRELHTVAHSQRDTHNKKKGRDISLAAISKRITVITLATLFFLSPLPFFFQGVTGQGTLIYNNSTPFSIQPESVPKGLTMIFPSWLTWCSEEKWYEVNISNWALTNSLRHRLYISSPATYYLTPISTAEVAYKTSPLGTRLNINIWTHPHPAHITYSPSYRR